MPFLKVTGGPIAPVGKTLAADTRLIITFEEPYVDGVYSYPTNHFAAIDLQSNGWKPLGSNDGIDFYIPGGASGYPKPPTCILKEVQVFADGTSRSFIRGPIRIYASSSGEWAYATPESNAIFVSDPDVPPANALLTTDMGVPGGVASLDANGYILQQPRLYTFRVTSSGTLFIGPPGWQWTKTGTGVYSLNHYLNSTELAWFFSVPYSGSSYGNTVQAGFSGNPDNVNIQVVNASGTAIDSEFWGFVTRLPPWN